MKRFFKLSSIMTLALGLVFWGCSDDTQVPLDKGPGKDQKVTADAGTDVGGKKDIGGKKDGAVEAGPDITPPEASMPEASTPDSAVVDLAPPDTSIPDAPVTDSLVCSSNALCKCPKQLTLTPGKATTVTGTTKGATNQFAKTIKCGTSFDFDGHQLYYKATFLKGVTYKVELTPTSSWDPALYMFTDTTCDKTKINTQCAKYVSDKSTSGKAEFLFVTPTVNTDFIIAVDTYSATQTGTFSLTISEFKAAVNSTCIKAKPVTLTAGKATVKGDTTGVANEYGSTVKCGKSSAFAGPQVYYKITMTAGQTLKLKLSPSFTSYMYVFPFTACGASGSIDLACGSKGQTGDVYGSVSSGSSGTMMFKATTGGDYVIAVDSTSTSYSGSFTLDIEDFKPAAHSSCSGALPITLTGGKATGSGDTSKGINEYGSNIKCGGSSAFIGPQLYYKVTLKAGSSYLLSITPTFYAYMYIFPAAACGTAANIETGCTGHKIGSISSGSTGSLIFKPTKAGDYIVAVDSTSVSSSYQGKFDLAVQEMTAPANDTCKTASPLTFPTGLDKITEMSYTLGATNKVSLTSSDCTKNKTDGPDVFYSMTMVKGTTYTLTLDGKAVGSGSFNESLYVFTDCTKVASTCGKNMGADTYSSSSEKVTITPTATGTFYIGVDGRAATDKGTFTLTITKKILPKNNTCAGAIALPAFVSGVAQVTGDTTLATNSVSLTSSSCVKWTTAGPDLFYSVQLTAGKSYTFDLQPSSTYDSQLYVFASCANPQNTCVGGHDNTTKGGAEKVTYKAKQTGTAYIGVDSYWSTSADGKGTFTLKVTEK